MVQYSALMGVLSLKLVSVHNTYFIKGATDENYKGQKMTVVLLWAILNRL